MKFTAMQSVLDLMLGKHKYMALTAVFQVSDSCSRLLLFFFSEELVSEGERDVE